ncbi:MAG: 30S ribosomal protein S6 [Xanthobacteraceae bacterium]
MPLYEHVFLARQDISAQVAEELAAQYKGVIEQNGGTIVVAPEYWGIKTLNYRIRKNRKAHFSMLRIDAPPAAVEEMERQERINEDVLRFLTVRVEQHEEGPSIMLQKRDREERREERRGERRRDRDGDEGDADVVPEAEEVSI